MNRPKAAMIKPAAKTTANAATKAAMNPTKENIVFGIRTNGQAKQQFAIMAAEQNRTQQELFAEALNDFFEKYGKGRIA